MSVGVGIARLDAMSEGEEHRFGVLELVGEKLQANQRTNASHKFVEVDGLAEKIFSAAIDALDSIFGSGEASDQHDWSETRLGSGLDLAADFESAHAGHENIEKHQVWAKRSTRGQRRRSVAGFTDFIAFSPEEQRQRGASGRFVVNDQNSFSHSLHATIRTELHTSGAAKQKERIRSLGFSWINGIFRRPPE